MEIGDLSESPDVPPISKPNQSDLRDIPIFFFKCVLTVQNLKSIKNVPADGFGKSDRDGRGGRHRILPLEQGFQEDSGPES